MHHSKNSKRMYGALLKEEDFGHFIEWIRNHGATSIKISDETISFEGGNSRKERFRIAAGEYVLCRPTKRGWFSYFSVLKRKDLEEKYNIEESILCYCEEQKQWKLAVLIVRRKEKK